MKIGIISDIHAYIKPLKQAISLFESQDVDIILCAGDLVDGGWDEEAVIDYIRSYDVLSVRGNHDREAIANQLEPYAEELDDSDWDGDLLGMYRIQYLNTLPLCRHFDWEGLRICLAHGTPWSDIYHVFPSVSSDICKKVLDTANADIVILGHTHVPMKLKINQKWIFNSGALAGNRENLQRTCGILRLPEVEFELFDVDTKKPVKLETKIIEN